MKAILGILPPPPRFPVAALSPPEPWAPGEGAKSQVIWEGFRAEGQEQQRMGPGQAREPAHIWRADAKASGSWQLVR